ncbi:MAG: CoA-transferase, partial [Nitrospinota bacterium]
MAGKLLSLEEAASLVPEGALLGMGGFTIGRCPMAFTHALLRRGAGGLTLTGTNLSLPADLLIAAGQVVGVDSGTVSL